MSVFEYINEKQRFFFAFISVLGVITNIIAFWIYDRTLVYHKEIQNWQEQKYKDNLDLAYYNMLEEKLAQAKIMRHDFKEHPAFANLKGYVKVTPSQELSDMLVDEG